MLDALKTLFENDVVSEEVRHEIEEAWNAKVKENRQQVTAELREEFAQKYDHDKKVMVEAIDTMLSERLASEIEEFAEDRKQLAEAKAKYVVAMRENAGLLKTFVVDQLSKEVGELHEDQKSMANKFKMLEDFVVESLAKEIAEFNEDKKDLAETKVRLVREAKSHFNKLKTQFVEKSADKVAKITDKVLNREIGQLKEDIESARKNDFGRKLFEAFASEYANSYLNEKSETSKLLKVVELKDKQLAEAKVQVAKKQKIAESKDEEIRKISDAAKRNKTINELIAPLSKDQKGIMEDLLESVQTDRLQSAFDKYLPAVIDGKTPAKKAVITEGKEITGNREETNVSDKASDNNVIELRKLAGLN
jgi:mRNA-degrading endonuclease toxin of MazEF toxin-antitoxin module